MKIQAADLRTGDVIRTEGGATVTVRALTRGPGGIVTVNPDAPDQLDGHAWQWVEVVSRRAEPTPAVEGPALAEESEPPMTRCPRCTGDLGAGSRVVTDCSINVCGECGSAKRLSSAPAPPTSAEPSMTTHPYHHDEQTMLLLGDALRELRTLPDDSVDAVITDPPYEIGYGGHTWDSTGIAYSVPLWTECLRILKPGGHLLAFGAARTYHRMVCAAEDAGFRVIDQLDWIYTHGKPKGTDLARAIDRRRDDREQVLQVTAWLKNATTAAGWTTSQLNTLFGFRGGMAGHWVTQGVAAAVPTRDQWTHLTAALDLDDTEIRPLVEELWRRKGTVGDAYHRREVINERATSTTRTDATRGYSGHRIKARAASDEARRWEGWNTTLKPAHDPILLGRKSTGFDTLTASVLKRGTGGLHTAACPAQGGGWPTNILLGHDCHGPCESGCPVRETGSRARSFPVFRLESRTPSAERVEVDGLRHDTPKPLALMEWLVRLATPPGGTILDPFAGSGTTLVAARNEGAHAIGIEQHEPYARIAAHRLTLPSEQPLPI